MTSHLRKERDSMGTVGVPKSALWGAQTQRSLENFSIGYEKIPIGLIHALALIKQAAAISNYRLGVLNEYERDLIVEAAISIAHGKHDNQFPLKVWQTGSGTQTNMNVNEVISNLASIASGNDLGSHKPLHPNDHVNKSQSTNDVFPSAIHISAAERITNFLLPELDKFINSLDIKSNKWQGIIKVGRTHLQDAVPISLGQEVSAWRDQVSNCKARIQDSLKELFPLPLGGTAVGTGVNTPPNFDIEITKEISLLTNLPFYSSINKFALMASHDGLVNSMSQLRILAGTLLKIVNDIRLLACGPRAGLGELILPANEPGSSIMPGKINPTQCEAMAMICTQIIGLDLAVSLAGSGGHLQMNVYKPLIGFNLLNSIELLLDSLQSCRVSMIEDMEPNRQKIHNDLQQSLMLVTALAPEIGYEKASEIAHKAYKENLNLRQAAIKLGYIDEIEFDRLTDPSSMANPHS